MGSGLARFTKKIDLKENRQDEQTGQTGQTRDVQKKQYV